MKASEITKEKFIADYVSRRETLNMEVSLSNLFDKYISPLKKKAEKWDALDEKVGKFYEEESTADLVDIGEAAASAFGYL